MVRAGVRVAEHAIAGAGAGIAVVHAVLVLVKDNVVVAGDQHGQPQWQPDKTAAIHVADSYVKAPLTSLSPCRTTQVSRFAVT